MPVRDTPKTVCLTSTIEMKLRDVVISRSMKHKKHVQGHTGGEGRYRMVAKSRVPYPLPLGVFLPIEQNMQWKIFNKVTGGKTVFLPVLLRTPFREDCCLRIFVLRAFMDWQLLHDEKTNVFVITHSARRRS